MLELSIEGSKIVATNDYFPEEDTKLGLCLQENAEDDTSDSSSVSSDDDISTAGNQHWQHMGRGRDRDRDRGRSHS
ncbi:uncharacterized protein OCT59_026584 [Rhizophagus irregularis]|uniref:uncharacterized protein n=1 Tax=Rhizophagus irregularis TaxID=588596 RepID=UPI00332DAD55|nr:hypothetical protein OCT59_026584 [Rhizophagus irregularis]